ncbi:hypothetical protein NQ317_012062 [Molorchus minor]|uniref:Afadin n=1 Tax=Molorchus minor TaxID=1323400 RepID=A0ABQ9K8G5_9CUCU|nr:hypothetical protein NQ317_012062 [Molorchus minor]
MEVGSANGIALQLYGPHIQPRHCVITNTEGVTSLTPCHADAHTYVNGQRIHQTTILTHGSLVKFGHSNTYRFLDPAQEDRTRQTFANTNLENSNRIYDSPTNTSRENIETTFDLEGNVETISTASGAREDNRSLGSSSENRLSGIDRYPRGQDPILPAVLEFPEEPQEQFLARVVTHLDVTTPTFRLAPAYTLYLCARYRASTHYRPELTPTERAHKLTLLLQHAAMLIRHTVQDRSTESTSQAFWLANASELLHFLKSDRHVSAFSLQAQDTLADAVQLAFKNLVACLTDELNSAMAYLMSVTGDDQPREVINILSGAMNLLRKCRVNAALTIQLFSQLFHWISAKALSNVISNNNLCTRNFGNKLYNRLRNLQAWAESQGLELAAECHLAKIVQCAHLLQAPKFAPEDLASLSAACFKLNSMQLGALLMQYKAKAAESVADELARAEGREVTLYEDPAPPLQLLLPDDGFSCDVVQGVPPGLADFLHPLQASGLCRLAAQPTSSGHWTVYMSAPRPPSALSATQPEIQSIRLHKAGGGMGLSIVAAKGAGQERLGIYIKSVVPGGAADRDGRLAAGDQLLSVDGQSLLGITQEKAAEFLQRTGSVVTLEVAKAGAVYHGLATLLQQPSPTPHRGVLRLAIVYFLFAHAAVDYNFYDDIQSSQESLYSPQNYRLFTPPATRPQTNVFFNSDDSLFKSERRKFTIPRIEIVSDEPAFNLQVEDYCVKPVNKCWKDKANNFVQQKSYSIEVNDSSFYKDDTGYADKFLNISSQKYKQRWSSASLQDLSSSTSSITSGVHESNLDLSQLDSDTPIKHKNWKSPYEIRFNGNAKDLAKQSECKAISVPTLNKKKSMTSRSKSVSEEKLNEKLSEYERLEIFKLLQDWSLNGSESKSDFTVSRSVYKDSGCIEKENLEKSEKTNLKHSVRFLSEPDLSPKCKQKINTAITKYNSNDHIDKELISSDFSHKCAFRNCIFNIEFLPIEGTKIQDSTIDDSIRCKPKGILKNSKERLEEVECLNNITNLQRKANSFSRCFSEIIIESNTPFNSQLVRCDSLERLTDIQRKYKEHKKFPESYIITRYAKKTCPVLKNCSHSPRATRKAQSCASIEQDNLYCAARLAALTDCQLDVFTRPRRMSERDLPSRVDSEKTIPSSKSVPALHQIHNSSNNEQSRPNPESFNTGYSRTSSNNSINNNHLPQGAPNGPAPNPTTHRSRSTHNLHQQDGGFYQNLSIYRNKIPSPQHLGDRTSALRSSQNSLHSSVANSQRPSSAYYPPHTVIANPRPNNLHQSIPNLKCPPSSHRLHGEDSRTGSFPSVNHQPYGPSYNQNYTHNSQYMKQNQNYTEEINKMPYGSSSYVGANYKDNQSYPSPTNSSTSTYPNGVQQSLHVISRQEDRPSQEEIMRYPSQNNIRISEAQIQHSDLSRHNEMRTSKSEDMLKHHGQNDTMRYASSGNIRANESNKIDIPQLRQHPEHIQQHRLSNEDRHLRSGAKLAEMSEEVKRRQNRILSPQYGHPQHPNSNQYYQQQQYYNHMISQNAQSMQNLNLTYQSQQHPPHSQMNNPQLNPYMQQHSKMPNSPMSPSYKIPPVAPKPNRKEDLPELPPTSTHPLYSASSQDPPKMSFYATGGPQSTKPPRDPWAREEQERQQEARREAARQWQEQQIRELASLPYRTSQQEEQLRVLQLEREFQRRAMETAEHDDEDTEKESPTPQPVATQSVSSSISSTTTATSKQEQPQIPPTSILKPGSSGGSHTICQPQSSVPETSVAPPPPERGSSFAVMSMRAKETTKRVSFNDTSAASPAQQQQPPNTLHVEEPIREDPNSFIRQAESMLASPNTPTDASASVATTTPGVIGAQEVYRDPRARRLAEQAQRKDQSQNSAVPEKLSFKEKMKMFAMETGEQETPKDKSKISRAQREIDNLGSPSLVH